MFTRGGFICNKRKIGFAVSRWDFLNNKNFQLANARALNAYVANESDLKNLTRNFYWCCALYQQKNLMQGARLVNKGGKN